MSIWLLELEKKYKSGRIELTWLKDIREPRLKAAPAFLVLGRGCFSDFYPAGTRHGLH
jgi:hypothetical protein